jgi:hypothetical protein
MQLRPPSRGHFLPGCLHVGPDRLPALASVLSPANLVDPAILRVLEIDAGMSGEATTARFRLRYPRLSNASGAGPKAPDTVLRDLPPSCRPRGGWTEFRTAAPMRRLPAHDRGRGAGPATARAALATGKVALSADMWTAKSQVVGLNATSRGPGRPAIGLSSSPSLTGCSQSARLAG